MPSESTPISSDEVLYRRLQLETYDPDRDAHPSPDGFHPNKHDADGISLFREKYVTPEELAATGRRPFYWVAAFRVAELLSHGVVIAIREGRGGPGHVELPDLNYENRYDDEADILKKLLAASCFEIIGPVPGKKQPD